MDAKENQIETIAAYGRFLNEYLIGFILSIENDKIRHSLQTKSMKRLTIAELKTAIFNYFSVSSIEELAESNIFRYHAKILADEYYEDIKQGERRLPPLDFEIRVTGKNTRYKLVFSKATWEYLYRRFVGILPHEEGMEGDWCINGINIFYYFKPWRVFGLDPKKATSLEIEEAYTEVKLFAIAMDMDEAALSRIDVMYRSITFTM